MFFTVKHEYAHILFGTLFLTELEDGKLKIGFSDLFFSPSLKKITVIYVWSIHTLRKMGMKKITYYNAGMYS